MKTSARHEFTLRHLVIRKFGVHRVEEALIGPQSFPACLTNAINQVKHWQYLILFGLDLITFLIYLQCSLLTGVKSIPSVERPSPGKLGYYIGGHTGNIRVIGGCVFNIGGHAGNIGAIWGCVFNIGGHTSNNGVIVGCVFNIGGHTSNNGVIVGCVFNIGGHTDNIRVIEGCVYNTGSHTVTLESLQAVYLILEATQVTLESL